MKRTSPPTMPHMRLELSDLPPRYRARAEAQLMRRPSGGDIAAAAKAARRSGHEFESRGEYEYYLKVIFPALQSGRLVKAAPHVSFALLPAKEYGGVKLPAARYTADYMLEHSTGEVEIVEIKSKFTRRMQRDYIYRRRLFIDLIAEPRGWKFTEVITPDTKDEVRAWKKAQEASK